jgi:hypothetical protein
MAALGPTIRTWTDYLEELSDSRHTTQCEPPITLASAKAALKLRQCITKDLLTKQFGQHVVDLVYFHVDQGPNPRGCFGTSMVDPMHIFEEGVVLYILARNQPHDQWDEECWHRSWSHDPLTRDSL